MSDWNQLLHFIRQHFSVAIVFSIIFAVGMAYLWGENKSIQAERNAMYEREIKFRDEKIQFERDKAEFKLEFKEMQTTVLQTAENTKARMEQLQQMLTAMENEPSIQEKQRDLASLIAQYNHSTQLLNEEVSIEKRRNAAHEWIVKAMSDFSKLGVDLGSPEPCDKEYMKRYNEGVALINQIRAWNESYLKNKEIDTFVRINEKVGVVVYGDECENVSALQ